MRWKILLWALLLIASFLIGFIPSYSRANRLDKQVAAARETAAQLRLRDAIGAAYFEFSQHNYGIAQDAATSFFVRAREAHDRTSDPALKAALEPVLGEQSALMAKLGNRDESALNDLAKLYRQIQQATRGAGAAQ